MPPCECGYQPWSVAALHLHLNGLCLIRVRWDKICQVAAELLKAHPAMPVTEAFDRAERDEPFITKRQEAFAAEAQRRLADYARRAQEQRLERDAK